jgi:hypothetical protein
MARAKPPAAPPDRVAAYDRLLAAARPPIERKGAANPYTSLNGHMYSFLSASGLLALRLPGEPLERFLRDHAAALFIGPHGKPMPTFAAVPDGLLDDTAKLVPWLELARDHVAGQKPKPTTRSKAAKD